MPIQTREDWLKTNTQPNMSHVERVIEGLNANLKQLGRALAVSEYNVNGSVAARYVEEIKGLNTLPTVSTVYYLQHALKQAGWTLSIEYVREKDTMLDDLRSLSSRRPGTREELRLPDIGKERKVTHVHYVLWMQNFRH